MDQRTQSDRFSGGDTCGFTSQYSVGHLAKFVLNCLSWQEAGWKENGEFVRWSGVNPADLGSVGYAVWRCCMAPAGPSGLWLGPVWRTGLLCSAISGFAGVLLKWNYSAV